MRILQEHFIMYPEMRPVDAIKLLYQRAFGGGHIVEDPDRALDFLRREHENIPHGRDFPRVEKIGGGVVRLYLDGIPTTSVGTVNHLFVDSAATHRGDAAAFAASLDACTAAVQRGETPFSPAEWQDVLARYRKEGCPLVRHSAAYRAAYAPAYRVIAEKYVPLLPLLFAIDAKIARAGHAVLAVDGMCGSGKSTLSRLLLRWYDAAVVSMDDFFLPPSLRTPARLCAAGGNIHHERFRAEVLPHLGEDPFTYRAFDCGTMTEGAAVTVPLCPLTVVEGSYALHPALQGRYDVTAYLFCTPEEQTARLRARCESDGLLRRFREEWIPMEMRYEEAFSVRAGADFVIDTTDLDWREEGQL